MREDGGIDKVCEGTEIWAWTVRAWISRNGVLKGM
jgi:hypothetical protein